MCFMCCYVACLDWHPCVAVDSVMLLVSIPDINALTCIRGYCMFKLLFEMVGNAALTVNIEDSIPNENW